MNIQFHILLDFTPLCKDCEIISIFSFLVSAFQCQFFKMLLLQLKMLSYHKSCVRLQNTNYFSHSMLSLFHEDCFWNNVMNYELQLGRLK